MSQIHGTQANFDPLTGGVEKDAPAPTTGPAVGVPTVVHGDSSSSSATPTTGNAATDYDSFMTARSHMSYMTASTQSTAATSGLTGVLPQQSNPFRRLPDRDQMANPPALPSVPAPASDARAGGDSLSNSYNPFATPLLPQPPPQGPSPEAGDTSNPFAAPLMPYPTPPPLPAAAPLSPQPQPYAASSVPIASAPASLGPLLFGDDGGGLAGTSATGEARGLHAGVSDTTFAMPLDLYDTPESFAQPQARSVPQAATQTVAIGTVQPAATATPQLPPLANFTRDLSRTLPVSEDPISPPSVSPAGWYENHNTGTGVAPYEGGAGTGAAGLFGTVGDGASGSSNGGAYLSYAAAALLTNTVSVHSPRKAVAPSRIPGLSEPYTMYRVTSRGATVSETTVDRRFRDVVALGELLQALYPGCFVPPRPSRNALEARRMQPAFIEERRFGMEKFLKRLVVHPVFGPSEAIQVWLRCPTADLRTSPEWLRLQPSGPPGLARSTARLLSQVVGRERTVPSPLEVTRPASERGDMYRMVHERTAQLRGVLARVQPSPAEELLRQEAAALQERSELLLTLSRRADHWVARGVKSARVAVDLAGALGALAAADEGAPPAAGPTSRGALQQASEGCEKVGKLYGVATDASAKHLTPLHDWLAAAPGATAGLAARERCLLTVATLQSDEQETKTRLAEAEPRSVTSPAAAKKVEGLRLQASQLAAAVGAARDEYERVGGRNTAELAAFKAQMSRELADAVREFALVQLAAAQKAHEMWRETAGALVQLAAAAAAPPPGGAALGSGVSLGVGLGGSRGGSSSQLSYGTTAAY